MDEEFRCDPRPGTRDGPRRQLGWSALTLGLFAVLLGPAVGQLVAGPSGPLQLVTILVATAVLAALFARLLAPGRQEHRVPLFELSVFVAVALGLAVQDTSWMPALALATLVVARRSPSLLAAVMVAVLSGLAGALVWLGGDDEATAASMLLVSGIMGGFGYLSRRSALISAQLHLTERELARMAVAEERLRIARELHDLLGHSLSLIALKAELAGNLLPAEVDRARREIGDVESVARRSLSEVRQAVTGYRAPSLTAELATARRSIDTAGITCRLDTPEEWSLPRDIEGLLAWTIREGATNVIRHSRAANCTLRLTVADKEVEAEVVDDGDAAVSPGTPTKGNQGTGAGSGLAGLAERAGRLGGQVDAGPWDGGFRLRVRVPLEGLP